jgi:tRNA threonylcarbamoyladenosine biosynthesis protein TsaE
MPDLELVVPTAEDMRNLGRQLAGTLAAGDLVLLTGDLGAGKTTLTQGIGDALGVQGTVASPTFVIARVHRASAGGPPLVHVDAYRLGGWDELEDLDLEASLDDAVTVVEWGTGIAEGLADRRLEIEIVRTHGGEPAEGSEDRMVRVRAIGRELPGLASAVAE